MAVPDVGVQRDHTFFASGETTVTQSITAVGSLTSAFVRVTNVVGATRGDGSVAGERVRDMGVAPYLSDTSTITFERGTNAADITVYWEVIEYTGAAGGPNEWFVRHQAIVTMTGADETVSLDAAIGTLTDSVVEITGVWGDTNLAARYQSARGKRDTTTQCTVSVQALSGQLVGVAVIEYTGSGWTVGYDTFTTNGTTSSETHTLSTGVADWAKTMLVSSWVGDAVSNIDDTQALLYPGTVANVKSFIPESDRTLDYAIYTVEHSDLVVEHDDSVDGGLAQYANGALAQTYAITAVTPASASVRGLLAANDTTKDYAKYWLDYWLDSSTEVKFAGAFATSVVSDIALQIISFAQIVSADTATPLVQLATRAPTDRQFPPVDAAYLFKSGTSQNKLMAAPGVAHAIQVTGSFRIEMDLAFGDYTPSSTAITLLQVAETGLGTDRIQFEVNQLGQLVIKLTDTAGNTDTETQIAIFSAATGKGVHVRFAVDWVSSTGVATIETGEISSTDLAATSWTTFGTVVLNAATVLNTDRCDWWIGSGGDNDNEWKFVQMRVFDKSSGTVLVADVVAADGAASKVVDRVGTLDWDYQGTTTLYPYGDWEDISSAVRYQSGVKTKRGRSTDLGNMNAGTMSLTLDNLNRDFEPEFAGSTHYPAIVPFIPIRFIAMHASVLLPLWRGFVRSWTPVYNNLDAVTQVQCVDGFRPLNLKQTGSPLTAAITDLSPVGFWPMTEASGVLVDGSTNSNDLTLTGTQTRQGSQVTYGDRRPVLTWNASGDASDASPGSELFLNGDLSFFLAHVQTTDTDLLVFNVGTATDFVEAFYFPGASSFGSAVFLKRTVASVDATVDTIPGGADPDNAPITIDGVPHQVVGTYQASTGTLKYYLDGELMATTVGGSTPTPTLTGGSFTIGEIGFGFALEGGMGFVAVWDRVLTDYEAATLTALKLDGSAQGPPGTRVDDLLDLAEWPDNERNIETGSTTLVAKDASDTQVLAEIQTSETADIGEFFVAANGDATYRARGWRATNRPTAQATFGDQSPELPYTTLAFEFNETRIVNHWEITPADGDTGVAVDLTSIQQFGRRKQTQTLDLLDGDAAQIYADNRLAARKDPDLIVRQLSIAASRDPVNLLPVLLGTEISDRYTITRRPPGGGDPISNDAFVESISIECRSETEWYFILELSPLL